MLTQGTSMKRSNVERSPGDRGEVEDVRMQALTKQLSQLDATSSKIAETLRFISDFNKDNGGTVLGSHAPQHLQQLQALRQKLKDAVVEIEELQGTEGRQLFPAKQSEQRSPLSRQSPEVEEGSQIHPAAPAASTDVFDRPSQMSSGGGSSNAAANDGGTVTGTVSRLTREAAEESAAALARVREEQRRLQALKKEIADLQRENELTSRELSSRDVRMLREQSSMRQSQLREAQAAEEELRQLTALSSRLQQMRAEAETLRPVVAEVAALELQLQHLRGVEAQRVSLSREIASLQPKVMLVEKMQHKVEQLELELQRGEGLQARVQVLQAEAEKLPGLRSRMYSLQASAAEARQLEKLMLDYGRQEELLVRLQHQEQEMQARVSGIEDLKRQVEALKLTSKEADQLEVQFAGLASTASRLPVLRGQVQQLRERCDEMGQLEAELERLQQVDVQCKALRRQVEELRPQAEALEVLQAEVRAMQQAVAEAEALRAGSQVQSPHLAYARAAPLPGAVQAAVRSLSLGHAGGAAPEPEAPPPSLPVSPKPAVVRLNVNIVAPEPPLLPPGVSAELARRREEVRALAEAEAELRNLGRHSELLQRQVEALRASPAAAEVVRLQTQLLEMQGREVQQLTAEVAGLAGAGEKLAALREQHEVLEKEADEVFVLQAQLPELESVAAQAGLLRRRRDTLLAERAQVLQLEAEIAEAEDALCRRPALEAKLRELHAQRDAMEMMLIEAPAVEAKVAKLRAKHEEMQVKAAHADQMVESLHSLRRQMVLATGMTPAAPAAAVTTAAAANAASISAKGVPALPEGGAELEDATAAESAATAADETPLPPAATAAANGGSGSGSSGEAANSSSLGGALAESVDGVASDAGWQLVAPVTEEEEDTAVMAAHLDQVRAKHAALLAQRQELLRLSAESQLLLKDNEVLRMQLNVAVSMYSAAKAAPPRSEGPAGDAGGGLPEEQAAPGAPQAEAAASEPGCSASLDAVFQRMRVLESEVLGLQARNEELECEVDSLKAALEASLSRLDAFKGLAATVGMIRGKKKASAGPE